LKKERKHFRIGRTRSQRLPPDIRGLRSDGGSAKTQIQRHTPIQRLMIGDMRHTQLRVALAGCLCQGACARIFGVAAVKVCASCNQDGDSVGAFYL